MDKIELFGKTFSVVTYENATPTNCNANKKSAFADTLLFNLQYDLSGVDTSKSWDELTPEEQSKVISLRAKTPVITAKDSGLRSFVLKELNKGKEDADKITLSDLNTKLFADGNFDENGLISDDANETLKSYCKKVCKMLLSGKRNVYYVSMSVNELTGGKFQTWQSDFSDKPLSDVVAYEIDPNNLLNAAMSAAARMFATLPNVAEEEEE